ncbi:MAG: hypothetical protein HY331_12860 [Chloroflexi bacterium]|nr:hypothetical protein [Chloroflexota bacterium]
MKKQTIQWIALPNGIVAGRLRLSVFILPRLQDTARTRTTLDEYPDFLDWPARPISFAVRFNASPPVQATRVGQPPSLARWQALFYEETFVRPYRFARYDDRIIRSYPARHVMDFLKGRYVAALALSASGLLDASSPNGLIPAAWLTHQGSFGPLGYVRRVPTSPQAATTVEVSTEQEYRTRLEQSLASQRALKPGPADPPMDFMQLKLFHRARNARRVGDTQPWEPLPLPEVDFHQVLSSMGQYPRILRELGIVHDLEVPLPANLPPKGTVQVIPTWSAVRSRRAGVSHVDLKPKTRYVADAGTFAPAPRSTDPDLHPTGLLRLDDSGAYDLVQVDVDGAAIKAMDFAGNLFRAGRTQTADTPQAYSVPSLRSAGLSVIRVGRAYRFRQALITATQRNADVEQYRESTFDAEELTRGYRFDIWDAGRNQWYSLSRRHGTYTFLQLDGTPGATIEDGDEGFVSTALTQAADRSSPDLYLQESLFHWQGWSLAAPRPGRSIDADDLPADIHNTARTQFPLEVKFTATPGSLPRLRFGRTYRVRARMADLAGNGPLYTRPGLTGATGEIVYSRFEPISSPVILPRKARTLGESVERVVIRRYATHDPVEDTWTLDPTTLLSFAKFR